MSVLLVVAAVERAAQAELAVLGCHVVAAGTEAIPGDGSDLEVCQGERGWPGDTEVEFALARGVAAPAGLDVAHAVASSLSPPL
jgi:hypothetical protein